MFTTLTNWLRPSARRPHPGRVLPATIERLEDRTVPNANPWPLQQPDANGFPSPNPLTQDWSNTGLITTNSWANVPSIVGFLGNGLTAGVGVDPQTITGPTSGGTTQFVSANQTDPNTFSTGGPAEFDTLTDPTYGPTVALKGDSTAKAPYLQFYLDTRQVGDVTISYVLRDIDGSANDAQQQFALQYRIGDSVPFTNVPQGYVSDATTGPNLATKVTNISVRLPAALNNQSLVELRIITSDAAGIDEWVGVDNIRISGNVAPVVQLPDAAYLENAAATPIAPAGTVTDPDSPNLMNGSLKVDFSPHSAFTTDDVFAIQNQGMGAGQIGVIGAQVYYGGAVIGTFTGGLATAPLVVSFTTADATPAAVQALLRAITYQNPSDNPNPTPRPLSITVADGDGSTGTATTPTPTIPPVPPAPRLTITAVDDPPVLTMSAGTVTFTENGPPVAIDAAATITDVDSPAFNGGSLTVAFNPNSAATPDDVLAVPNQGTGAGQIGLSGTTVTFSGIPIGTITSNGLGTNPLVVTFNPAGVGTNVTPSMAQTLLRAITFGNTSNNPDPTPRTLVVTVNDGGSTANGGVPTASASRQVAIVPVNDPPVVTTSTGTLTIGEKAPATVIDPGATVTDPDSADFAGGSLTVDFAAGADPGDVFGIQNQGTGAGQIGLSGNTVSYGGTAIGTFSGGLNGSALVVNFTSSNATPAAVTALLRAITFRTTSLNPPTAVRQAEFVVDDGDGGTSTSAPATRGVQITPVNDPPTVTTSGTVSYQAGFTPVVVTSAGTVTDPDSPTFNGGSLTATITGGAQAGDVLAVRNQGTGAGLIGVSGNTVSYGGLVIGTVSGNGNATPLVVAFTTADATQAAVTALLRNIAFHTPNGPGVAGNRAVSFVATDGQPVNGTSNTATATVAVNTGTAQPQDDFYDTNEDVPLVVPARGVLANDGAGTTADGVVTGPANGTVTLNPDGSFTYTPAANWNGTDTFTYAFSGAASGTAKVTIFVHPVNDPPAAVYNPGVPVTVNEDSGPQSFPLFVTYNPGGGPDEAGQTLTFSPYTITNPDLFSIPPVIDARGNLTFTPAPDAFGTSTVSITVTDNGGTTGNPLDQNTATLAFDIVVRPVNDRPSFRLLGDPPTVNEDAGPQTVSGFAFNFVPGPANESGQTPTYILTLVGQTGGLAFSAGPQIAADGTLTYTTAPNSNGTATFNVVVKDSGGTANGGVDTSTPAAFTVTVTPVNDPPTLRPDTATVNWNTGPNPIDVLANDSDAPDTGETLTVVGVTQGANGGTVAVTGGGTGVTYQPPVGFAGTDTFSYTVSDGNGGLSTAAVTVAVARPQTAARDIVALGAGPGGGSLVRVYDAKTGAFVAGFTAFDPSFKGGVSVATGDVNGDGVPDLIVGAGAGGGPRVMVIDGTKFGLLQGANEIANPAAILANLYVYDPSFTGGVTVAAGDINGDGKADVVVGAGPGGGPNVKVVSGARIDRIGPDGLPDDSAVLASFFAYDPNFRGGIHVAAGDVTGDGYADLVTTAGNGGGSHVKAFDGFRLVRSGPTGAGVLRASFFAYDPNFRGGVYVAAGDVNGDGVDEIITGAGPGGGSNVKVFEPSNPFAPIASFYAFGPAFAGGVDVAYRARSGGAGPWLVAGAASGESRVLGIGLPGLGLEASFDAFDPHFPGGVDVG